MGNVDQLSEITIDIFSTLTTQSYVKLSSLNYLRKFTPFPIKITTMVLIWLIFTSIMTKCFTSLLLNSYFRQIYVPLVNNLEDLVDNNFSILASDKSLQFMSKFGLLNKKQMNSVLKKRKIFNSLLDKTYINDLVNGLAVILLNGNQREIFETQYVKQRDKFKVLDKKYLGQFVVHMIHKNISYRDQLVFA